jgi:uncharacterized membrane protein
VSSQISVVVAYYRDPERCATALHSLELLSGAANALDAAVLQREEPGGHLRIVETADFRREQTSGVSVSTVFPDNVLALPSVGEATGEASAYFQEQGLEVNLLKEVGENLPPDGAALVIMIDESWLSELTSIVSGYADFERFVMHVDEGAA